MAQAINSVFGANTARPTDPSSVVVTVPQMRRGDIVGLMTEIEQLRVTPDQAARVVIDERSGVIVMGENVRISTVAIAQGNLTIRITENPQVSQPDPLANGQTVVTPQTDIQVDEQSTTASPSCPTASPSGTGRKPERPGRRPRDMICILQSIKAAGALQAEIEVM